MNDTFTIQQYTGMSDEQLNYFIFDSACEYLHQYYRISDVSRLTPYFWKWWRNRWRMIDEQYLDALTFDENGRFVFADNSSERIIPIKSEEQLLFWYKKLHSISSGHNYMSQNTMRLSGITKAIKC